MAAAALPFTEADWAPPDFLTALLAAELGLAAADLLLTRVEVAAFDLAVLAGLAGLAVAERVVREPFPRVDALLVLFCAMSFLIEFELIHWSLVSDLHVVRPQSNSLIQFMINLNNRSRMRLAKV